MQEDDKRTLVLSVGDAGVYYTAGGVCGSEIAGGLRELANQIDGLTGEQLRKHRAASVIHQYDGFYFVETSGCFITLCDNDMGGSTMVEIGNTLERAEHVLESQKGTLGGGLDACDEWHVALGYAIRSARQNARM